MLSVSLFCILYFFFHRFPSFTTVMIYPNILYQTLLKIFPFFLEILILPVALSMVCVCESLDVFYGVRKGGANIKAENAFKYYVFSTFNKTLESPDTTQSSSSTLLLHMSSIPWSDLTCLTFTRQSYSSTL